MNKSWILNLESKALLFPSAAFGGNTTAADLGLYKHRKNSVSCLWSSKRSTTIDLPGLFFWFWIPNWQAHQNWSGPPFSFLRWTIDYFLEVWLNSLNEIEMENSSVIFPGEMMLGLYSTSVGFVRTSPPCGLLSCSTFWPSGNSPGKLKVRKKLLNLLSGFQVLSTAESSFPFIGPLPCVNCKWNHQIMLGV